MQTVRILHIMSSFGGGISTFIYNLAKGASRQEMIFDVATYSAVPNYFSSAIEATGGKVYQLKNPKKTSWSSFEASYLKPLKEHKYQAVYCHISGYRALVYFYLMKRTQKNKNSDFYIHGHYRYLNSPQSLKEKILQTVDPFINHQLSRIPIGCSRMSVKELFKLKVEEPFVVVPNSIEPSEFFINATEKKEIKRYWQNKFKLKDKNALVIGQVGRLTAIKNHSFSFEIVRHSQRQAIQLYLVVAGEGEERSSLEEEVLKKGIQDQVYFAGRISPISELLAGIDLLIMPSFSEGFGTIAIEAQAAGVPVLASDQITREVDLGLGLIQFLELDSNSDNWYQTIVDFYHQVSHNLPSEQERLRRIQMKSFTNEAAAKLYRKVLDHQVNHFQID